MERTREHPGKLHILIFHVSDGPGTTKLLVLTEERGGGYYRLSSQVINRYAWPTDYQRT